MLLHLARKGVLVAAPVPLRDGGYVRCLSAPEGPRLAVHYTFAPGEPLSAPDHDAATAHAYGRVAAWLHTAADDLASPHARFRLDPITLIDAALATTLPLLAHRPDDRDDLIALARAAKECFARPPPVGWRSAPATVT